MSIADQTPNSDRNYFGPTLKYFLLVWLVMVAGGAALLYWTDRQTSVLKDDLNSVKQSSASLRETVAQGQPALMTEVTQLRQQLQTATQRLSGLESTLGTYNGQLEQLAVQASESQSRQAVERAKVAVIGAQVKTARERLQKLKAILSAWQAQEASLMSGDLGRRIAASPAHMALALGIVEEERPTSETLLEWELELESLAAPIEASNRDKDATLMVTAEHANRLTDLGQQLKRAIAQLEQHQFLLDALGKETASQNPASVTFAEVLRNRRSASVRQSTERILAAREQARAEAEKEHAERIALVERQIVEADIGRQEQIAKAKREQQEQLARTETEKIIEETRVKEAEARARIAGLRSEAVRLDAATQRAQLEKEFERDLPKIRSVLTPFTASGFQKRGPNKGEGPMSFAVIQGAGALAQTPDGRQNLADIVGNSDRPTQPLKRFRGGQTREEEAMCNLAQELLTKYGPLMVEKGMLAP